MSTNEHTPDVEIARELLNSLWNTVINEEQPKIVDQKIDRLINSKYVAIRYCLPTQVLGKLTDLKLDCLCLQKGSGKIPGSWDPRSFSSKVIVPWVAENNNVLGTSPDPYVGKPLRRVRIDEKPGNVKGKEEWVALYGVLKEVENNATKEFVSQTMTNILISIHNKLSGLLFEYYIPERVSLPQTEDIVDRFLSEGSGGDRGLSVAAALFETFSKYFGLYDKVNRHVINASDASTGATGDIECKDSNGKIKLAVEVKERELTLIDVRSGLQKARKSSLTEVLFNAPGTRNSEASEINEIIEKSWASGTNIYSLSINELIRVGLSLAGEESRTDFMRNVGKQLDEYNTQPINRKRWKDLLESI